jgi:hypothetical protein
VEESGRGSGWVAGGGWRQVGGSVGWAASVGRWAVAVRIGSRWPVGVVRAPLVLAKSENLARVL